MGQTRVSTTCHSIRRKRLRDLSDEELRLGIGQNMALPWLVPVALERLQANPLASGDMYEGALLKNVLAAAESSNLDSRQLSALDQIVIRLDEAARQLDTTWQTECLPAVSEVSVRSKCGGRL